MIASMWWSHIIIVFFSFIKITCVASAPIKINLCGKELSLEKLAKKIFDPNSYVIVDEKPDHVRDAYVIQIPAEYLEAAKSTDSPLACPVKEYIDEDVNRIPRNITTVELVNDTDLSHCRPRIKQIDYIVKKKCNGKLKIYEQRYQLFVVAYDYVVS